MKKFVLLFTLFLFSIIGSAQFHADTLMTIVNPADHEMMDVDNDGDLDLVVVGYDDIVWYENEGDEVYSAANYIEEDITGYFGIEAFDIDSDGFMDFTAYFLDGTRRISWFENNGDGTFTNNVITEVIAESHYLLDDDGDGDVELFYSIISDGVFRMAGNADGTFDAATVVDDAVYNYFQIYHSDYDNDGDQDLLMCTQDGPTKMKYCENLGGGTYAAATIVLDGLVDRVNIAAFADMDNDGDEDWILGQGLSEYFNLYYYENTGGALGEEYAFLELVGSRINVGDFDMDGYLDIAGSASKRQHKWIRNNGDGTFEEGVDMPVGYWGESAWLQELSSVHVYDTDGDGDLEVYGETTQGPFYFTRYTNLVISDYNATGNFFADLNENGVWDEDEVGVDFPGLESDPDEDAYFVNPGGDYFIGFPIEDDVSYTFSPVLPENWEISTPDEEYTVLIDGETEWDDLDFGIYPTEDIDSIETYLVGAFPRCNDTVNYWIITENFGTSRPDGSIHLVLDDSLTYVSSIFTPDSVVDQNVYWSYDSLSWYDDLTFSVQIAMPDFLSDGDDVTSSLTTTIMNDADEIVFTATDAMTQTIVCAYDPNDKIGFPYGVDDPGYISIDQEYMDYTIRFQNTGSDTAFTVRILDPLSDNFNEATFEILAASHEMEQGFNDFGTHQFLFENIELPDSTTDFAGSQGFVKFRVFMEEGLPVGTEFENTAFIYFDSNPAIVTNTELHTYYDCDTLLDNIVMSSFACFNDSVFATTDVFEVPSTTTYTWIIEDDTLVSDELAYLPEASGELEIAVLASTGFCEASTSYFVDVMAEVEPTELTAINLCFGDSVSVFGTYRNAAGVYADTLSTEGFGCDSILTQEVLLLPEVEITDLAPLSICIGDSIEVFGSFRSEAGFYYDSLETTEFGCDSIIAQELTFYTPTETTIEELADDLLCAGESSIPLIGAPAGGIFEGTGIVGDNFDPSASGTGTFTIYYNYEDDNSCMNSDSVTIAVVDCLGTEELSGSNFIIYPNPFSAVTTIQFNRNFTANESIVIMDVQGKQVRSYTNLTGNQLTIEKAELESGMYFVQLLNDKGEKLEMARLIVE